MWNRRGLWVPLEPTAAPPYPRILESFLGSKGPVQLSRIAHLLIPMAILACGDSNAQ
jgi:hypothetical protein